MSGLSPAALRLSSHKIVRSSSETCPMKSRLKRMRKPVTVTQKIVYGGCESELEQVGFQLSQEIIARESQCVVLLRVVGRWFTIFRQQ